MEKEKYLFALQKLLTKNDEDKHYSTVCLSYAERLLDNNLPVVFDIQHFSLLIGIDISEFTKMLFLEEQYYKEFKIRKKSGGERNLCIPAVQLKYIQRWILDNILSKIKISEYATGFCNKKSIVTNATMHVNKDCILNMDIKDFFPSILFERVFRIFTYFGYTKEMSFTLAKICTYNKRLPQGSPASPCISNIVCLKLDKRLSKLAESYHANYTRYADDITFSGNHGIKKCSVIIKEIVQDEGFTINEKKTRLAFKYQRQEVTGIIVNDNKIRLNKDYKRKLSQEIYFCTKYGISDHMKKINCDKAFYKEHLYGKAYFVKMIEPDEGKKMLGLLDKILWDY